MTESTIAPVVRQVIVHCSPAHAFEVFTTHFDEWWPRAHHICTAELVRATIEPKPDGASTVVTLEHRGFERSAGGDDLQGGVSGQGGWTDLLELFRARASARPDGGAA
ncbi:MAG TPA: hypothetical protein VGO03_17155 [Acidimicrobiia bacterium]|jgi:hypothetical protein